MKKLRLILVILVISGLQSCQVQRVPSEYYYIDVSDNDQYDYWIKRRSASADTLTGQLIATQTMLYFTPDSLAPDSSNDSVINRKLYVVSTGVKINGLWEQLDLEKIFALGGKPYQYLTKINKNNIGQELVSTARMAGIDSNILYEIPCTVILYLSNKIVPCLVENWCVYYNDKLFDFDVIEYSTCVVEMVG